MAEPAPARRHARALAVAALAALLLAPPAGAESCRHGLIREVGGWLRVDRNVGKPACLALLEAVRKTPAPHRSLLRDLVVVRMSRAPGRAARDSVGRVAAAATLVRYYRAAHTLVITDSGARGQARWRGGRPSAGDWAELRAVTGEALPVRPSAADLDRFLSRGVERLWGGRPSGEQIMLHAIGRIVYLAPRADEAFDDRLAGWPALTGWVDTDAEPEDAFQVPVDPRAQVCRLAGIAGRDCGGRYRPGPGKLPTGLARLSPSADFAESYRLVASGQGDRVSPERRLGIGALGWAAHRSLVEPGPPLERLSAEVALDGALKLLNGSVPPRDAVAILRAHGGALEAVADRLPDEPPRAPPADLPPAVLLELPVESFSLLLGERTVWVPPSRVARAWIDATLDWQAPLGAMPAVEAAMGAAESGAKDARRVLGVAERAVRRLDAAAERARYLGALAVAWGVLGDAARADGLLDELPGEMAGPRERARALVALARAHVAAGQWTPASKLLERAVEAADAVPLEPWRVDALGELAAAYARAGLHSTGLGLLERLGDSASAAAVRARVLATIAGWMGGEGEASRGPALLDRARRLVLAVPTRPERDAALARLAQAHERVLGMDAAIRFATGLSPRAEGVAWAALVLDASATDEATLGQQLGRRSKTTRAVALSRLAARDERWLEEAERALKRLPDRAARAAIQVPLARALVRSRHLDEAARVAAAVDPRFLTGVDVRGLVAIVRAEAGEVVTARKVARGIADPHHRRQVLDAVTALEGL